MKIFLILAFLLLTPIAFAIDCDYKIEIIHDSQAQWKIQATKIYGNASKTTATTSLIDEKGAIIKKYSAWADKEISSQKTSQSYEIHAKPENYIINARLETECNDINISNSAASLKIDTENAEKPKSQTEFDSSSEKMKNISIILLLITSIILNIILIWKR